MPRLIHGGRYIYLRDDDAPNSPILVTHLAADPPSLEGYQCRHGMGYTTIQSTFNGIKAETRYFIPLGASLEIWQLTLTNQRSEAVNLFRVCHSRILPVGCHG